MSFTAASTKAEFALKACTLSTTLDPDQTNNCPTVTAKLGGGSNPAPNPYTFTDQTGAVFASLDSPCFT